MSKILLPVFLFIVFFTFKSQTFAQNGSVWDFYSSYEDSSEQKIQFLNAVDGKYYMIRNNLFVFEHKHDLNRFLDTTGIGVPTTWDDKEINFAENTLVLLGYHGVDCHSKFKFGYKENDELKKSFIRITILYGGCRAGGRFYEKWALIPKLPEGYQVKISERVIDEIHNKYGEFKEE